MAWNLWFKTNTWIVLLIKLKALATVTLINYITNYVTSILLIIFWYYLLAPVTNFWKQTYLERYVPKPLEQGLFLPNTYPHNAFTPATAQLENFYYYKGLFYKFRVAFDIGQKWHFYWKKGLQNFTAPYSFPFLSVLYQNKVLHNVWKRGSIHSRWFFEWDIWNKTNFFYGLANVCTILRVSMKIVL